MTVVLAALAVLLLWAALLGILRLFSTVRGWFEAEPVYVPYSYLLLMWRREHDDGGLR